MRPAIESAKAFLAANSAHGKSDTTCTYIAALLDEITFERERCAKLAEQTETWNQTVEKTDHNDLYTGEYETVQRTGPRWRDGAAIAKAIRELKE